MLFEIVLLCPLDFVGGWIGCRVDWVCSGRDHSLCGSGGWGMCSVGRV